MTKKEAIKRAIKKCKKGKKDFEKCLLEEGFKIEKIKPSDINSIPESKHIKEIREIIRKLRRVRGV